MWVPRLGAIRGISSSVEDLVGADPVGPDPGRVDDVGGADLEALARLRVAKATPAAPAALVEHSGHLAPFTTTAPKRSASPRIGQHQAESSVWQS